MDDLYSRVTLSSGRAEQPAALPLDLQGLDNSSLRDIGASVQPVPAAYTGSGYWPVIVTVPDHDDRSRRPSGEYRLTVNAGEGTVGAEAVLRDLTDEEIDQLPQLQFTPISDRQFFQALAMEPYSLINTQEALDAVKTGEIPAIMEAIIDQLPPDAQFDATMKIAGGTTFNLDDPLVEVFGASQGMDAAAIRQFWTFAGSL